MSQKKYSPRQKIYFLIFLFSASSIPFSKNAIAQTCNPGINRSSCTISSETIPSVIAPGWSSAYAIYGKNNALTIDGNVDINILNSSTYENYSFTGLHANTGGRILGGGVTSIILRASETKQNIAEFGVSAVANGSIDIHTLNINALYVHEKALNNSSRESYGVQVGSGISGNEGSGNVVNLVKTHDANIIMQTTDNSVGSVTGYVMTGIRVITPDDRVDVDATYRSTGTTNIYVHSPKGNGYLSGIYLSGLGNQVYLNDSVINIGNAGSNSAGIIIGKERSIGTGENDILYSEGVMEIFSENKNVSGIRFQGPYANLLANYKDSRTTINVNNSAIIFGASDFTQNVLSEGQKASFRNAQFSTSSTSAPLIQATSYAKDAVLEVVGAESHIQANANGWMVEVGGTSSRTGNLTFNVAEQARIEGLTTVSKSSSVPAVPYGVLNINLDTGAQWVLKPKGDIYATEVSALQLKNHAVLDAGKNSRSTTGYILNASAGINNQSGLVKLDNALLPHQNILTIHGNYTGGAGARLQVNSMWNTAGDTPVTASDLLQLNGNVSGVTRVQIAAPSIGDVHAEDGIIYSADVIRIQGTETGTVFYGTAETSNAGIVKLVKNTDSSYAWTLAGSVTPGEPGTPENPDIPEPPDEPVYSESVPGYVTGAYINMELIRDSISHYRERKGGEYDKGHVPETTLNKNFWGRAWGRNMKGEGEKRLDWKSNSYGLQIGHEFNHQQEKETSITDDAYISYVHADSKKYDDYRFDSQSDGVHANKYTGSMRTHSFSAAVSRTYMDAAQRYKDMLLQVSMLNNRYYSNNGYGAENKGWAVSAAWEQGANYQLNQQWYAEPMYQVVLSYLSLKDFSDGARKVSQGNHWDGLLRAGGRLYHKEPINEAQNNLMYLQAYYARDFSHNGKATIGRDRITEDNARQWLELGLGFQQYRNQNTYFFLDAGIDRNLGGAYRHSYKVNAGVNHRW